jgi:hypothetical protein
MDFVSCGESLRESRMREGGTSMEATVKTLPFRSFLLYFTVSAVSFVAVSIHDGS